MTRRAKTGALVWYIWRYLARLLYVHLKNEKRERMLLYFFTDRSQAADLALLHMQKVPWGRVQVFANCHEIYDWRNVWWQWKEWKDIWISWIWTNSTIKNTYAWVMLTKMRWTPEQVLYISTKLRTHAWRRARAFERLFVSVSYTNCTSHSLTMYVSTITSNYAEN